MGCIIANVILPGLAFAPLFGLAILICEVAVYWAFFFRTHKFWKIVGIVILVNAISTLAGWTGLPRNTGIPLSHPDAIVGFPEAQSAEQKSDARWTGFKKFSIACALSILIETAALLLFVTSMKWPQAAAASTIANLASYTAMWLIYISIGSPSFR